MINIDAACGNNPEITEIRRRQYTQRYKKRVLRRVAEIGCSKTAKEFGISRKTVENWVYKQGGKSKTQQGKATQNVLLELVSENAPKGEQTLELDSKGVQTGYICKYCGYASTDKDDVERCAKSHPGIDSLKMHCRKHMAVPDALTIQRGEQTLIYLLASEATKEANICKGPLKILAVKQAIYRHIKSLNKEFITEIDDALAEVMH